MTATDARPIPARLTSLTGLLPTGTNLLASCFDAHHTVGGGLFALNGQITEIDRVSSSGLYADDDLLYRCLWSADGSPAELVVYDSTGVRRYHRLDDVSTPHDILAVDGDVLVAATMQNEVQCVGPDGEVRWRWQAPGEPDSWHLNSLVRFDGRVAVCGFGPFLRRRGWDENGRPASGQVIDIETGEPILRGLNAPHNPTNVDGTWLVCDSASGDLVELSGDEGAERRRLALPGWPRGLIHTDGHLFVGLSPHRYAETSVATAAIAVIDRSGWEIVGVVELPAREVYALALAPDELVEGARRGFTTNHTRVDEQAQRQLFDGLGLQPQRLWAIGDRLPPAERRARIEPTDPVPADLEAGALVTVNCRVTNSGAGMLTPAPPAPVQVVHRWYTEDGEPAPTQQITANLPRTLPPGGAVVVPVRVRVPERPGGYRLRITLAQDDELFDATDEQNALDVDLTVVDETAAAAAFAPFGLYPQEVRAAGTAGATVADVVHALLTRPDGRPRGLTIGLVADCGVTAFVDAVASMLRCSPGAVDHSVRTAMTEFADVELTGADAIALTLRRSGVDVAFAYAGTSELALCDSFSRLGVLINGRVTGEALFAAGGASRLRPGHGGAVLHGARGLTNALGALADLRRNEMGLVAVVGLPSTGSAPFLPPHGEPDLVSASGTFAKAWYELGPVPADRDGRAAAQRLFATQLQEAIAAARQAPYGPVLFAIPQDVAESAWMALSELPRPGSEPTPTPAGAGVLGEAAALLAAARRPVFIIDDYALVHEGLRSALAAVSDRCGAPVLQLKYRRGPMMFERLGSADVPQFLGWYDPADPTHRAVLDGADLLVTVEDRNLYPRVVGALPGCRKIAVTSKPAAVAKNGYCGPGDVVVHADVATALSALADAMVNRAHPADPWWPTAGDRRSGPDVPEDAAVIRTGVAEAFAHVAATGGGPVALVDDSQMFGGMLAEEYDHLPRGLRVFGGHGGFVGSGITVATGLAIGEPGTKVFCSLGDQGFTNSIQGLVAAVQEKAPVTFIVCNNGGAVSLRKQSRPRGWLDAGAGRYLDNAEGMDYVRVASALGVHAARVDLSAWHDREQSERTLRELREALGAAADHSGPSLVELVLPGDAEFWTGVWITEGFEQKKAPAASEVADHA